MTTITNPLPCEQWLHSSLPKRALPFPGELVRYEQGKEPLKVVSTYKVDLPNTNLKQVYIALQTPNDEPLAERPEVLTWFPDVGCTVDWMAGIYEQKISLHLRNLRHKQKDHPEQYDAIKKQIEKVKSTDLRHETHDLQSPIYQPMTVVSFDGKYAVCTNELMGGDRRLPISCLRVIGRKPNG